MSKEHLIAAIAVIFLVGWGVYAKLAGQRDSLKTYRNPVLGIEFQYPARFSEAPPPSGYGASTVAVFGTTKNMSEAVPDELLVVSKFEIPPGGTFEKVLLDETFFDGSGEHPTSTVAFAKKTLGGREFYAIRRGRFEGVLGFAYYLPFLSFVYRFDSIAQGVDWTNPNLDEENDPAHAALKEMLATLKFTR